MPVSVSAGPGLAVESEINKFLSFQVVGDLYAVSILRIKEIIEYGEVSPTPVPMMPDIIRGAINLRGKVVPVIDLSLKLCHREAEISRRTCIVIIELVVGSGRMDVGIIVDAVNEVLEISPDSIEAAPSFGGKVRTDFISGMGKVGEKFVVLLNIDRVLSMDDIDALDMATSGKAVDPVLSAQQQSSPAAAGEPAVAEDGVETASEEAGGQSLASFLGLDNDDGDVSSSETFLAGGESSPAEDEWPPEG